MMAVLSVLMMLPAGLHHGHLLLPPANSRGSHHPMVTLHQVDIRVECGWNPWKSHAEPKRHPDHAVAVSRLVAVFLDSILYHIDLHSHEDLLKGVQLIILKGHTYAI